MKVKSCGIYGTIVDSGWSEQEGVWWEIVWESYPERRIKYLSLDGITFI